MTVVLPFENINKYEFQRTYLTKETWLVFSKCDLSPSCFVIVYRVTVTGPLGHIIKREKVLQRDRYGRNSPMSLGRLLIQFHKLEAVSTPLSSPLPLRLNRKVCAVSGSFYIGKPRNWPIQSLSFMDLV